MKASTVINHTNPKPEYNCTHLEAWILGYFITRWNWRNVLLLFRPPVLESISIVAVDKDLIDPDDVFPPTVFQPNGSFFDTPLNHYVRLSLAGHDNTFLLNAGFLLNQFKIGSHHGFQVLKGLLKHAKKELSAPIDPTEDSDPGFQTPGPNIAG